MSSIGIFDTLAQGVVREGCKSNVAVQACREKFGQTGYVKLPGFLRRSVIQMLAKELQRLGQFRQRKDFTMPLYQTPRNLSVLGGSSIIQLSHILPMFYCNRDLRQTLSEIIGMELFTVHHKEEFMVANFLDGSGDTHGWHLDDPRYAFIVILDAPPKDFGGNVEFIPDWRSFCSTHGLQSDGEIDEAIQQARSRSMIHVARHSAGDCYLLNAAKNLHRVTRVLRSYTRVALNLAFDDREHVDYGNTADLLYGDLQVQQND